MMSRQLLIPFDLGAAFADCCKTLSIEWHLRRGTPTCASMMSSKDAFLCLLSVQTHACCNNMQVLQMLRQGPMQQLTNSRQAYGVHAVLTSSQRLPQQWCIHTQNKLLHACKATVHSAVSTDQYVCYSADLACGLKH